MKLDVDQIYKKFKSSPTKFNEEIHCKLLIQVMTDKNKGTMSAFCVEAVISDNKFWRWTKEHETFGELYSFCKMYSREAWEQEGFEFKNGEVPMGSSSFEYWKLIGWSRFGVSKNSRIRLHLNSNDTPDKHYAQLLKQASEGDFTASEIKQLMEAINVGLNTHQVFQLQKEIDQLKSDLVTMQANTDAHNSGANKGVKKDN